MSSAAPNPFREEQGRLDVESFYFAPEDELFAVAEREGFGWSVQRPHHRRLRSRERDEHGCHARPLRNLVPEGGRPTVFPGSSMQWNGLTDMTDARLLARHQQWAATDPDARNQAFNIVSGDVFRWSWMWGRIAAWFDVKPAPFPEQPSPLVSPMVDAAPLWAEIAGRNKLTEPNMGRPVSAWHTEADLGRPKEVLTDMSKGRKLGFLDYQFTADSSFDLFSRPREAHIIP